MSALSKTFLKSSHKDKRSEPIRDNCRIGNAMPGATRGRLSLITLPDFLGPALAVTSQINAVDIKVANAALSATPSFS